jgi:hypothetical protein
VLVRGRLVDCPPRPTAASSLLAGSSVTPRRVLLSVGLPAPRVRSPRVTGTLSTPTQIRWSSVPHRPWFAGETADGGWRMAQCQWVPLGGAALPSTPSPSRPPLGVRVLLPHRRCTVTAAQAPRRNVGVVTMRPSLQALPGPASAHAAGPPQVLCICACPLKAKVSGDSALRIPIIRTADRLFVLLLNQKDRRSEKEARRGLGKAMRQHRQA